MGVYALFRERCPSAVAAEHISFPRYTTIGCGGEAAFSVSPSDAEEAAEVLRLLKKEHIPYAFLGAGANTLPPDGENEAAVVRPNLLKGLILDGNCLFAGAGVTGGALLRFACEHGIGGFEPFIGIPMTVGGACVMNAGVRERHFADVTLRVLAVRGGRIESFPLEACKFGEKSSVFQEGIFVAGVLLRAERAPQERIYKKCGEFLARRASLPKGRSMGCTFVNPQGQSAGEIIDRCGLKGMRCGGAFVSMQHANFIINEGGNSRDVSELIDKVKAEVLQRTGIALREEIRRLTFYGST